MVSKLLITLLLFITVFSQWNNVPIINQGFNPSSGSGSNNPGSNDVDLEEDRADGVIQSLFGNNPSAARSLQSSSSPAPTSAPQGAALSASAPTAAQRSSAGLSLYPGSSFPIRWGRWVRILRCTFDWNGGFCCRWIWIWRYW